MLDLLPAQRPYALALLQTMVIDPPVHMLVREALAGAVIERRHDDYAALIKRQMEGKPLDGCHTLLAGVCEAHEMDHARTAQAWLYAALEAAALAHRLAPARPPWWAR